MTFLTFYLLSTIFGIGVFGMATYRDYKKFGKLGISVAWVFVIVFVLFIPFANLAATCVLLYTMFEDFFKKQI